MREFDTKYPKGIDADFNEYQRAYEDAWLVAQEQTAVDREHDPQHDPREHEDEYDPNTDAFDREMESRIERERERKWDDGRVFDKLFGPSEPPSVARSASDSHPYCPDTEGRCLYDHLNCPKVQFDCPLCAVDTSLKAHVVAFTHAVDSLEAVVQRLKQFLMVDGQGVK